MWIPGVYESFVRDVLDHADWPRELGAARVATDHPPVSVLGSSYDSVNRAGSVQVTTVGTDLVDVIDDTLGALRRAGAEQIVVYLPANQPALASLGAGVGVVESGLCRRHPRLRSARRCAGPAMAGRTRCRRFGVGVWRSVG